MRVGLVSDTHGRFDEALPLLLEGCELIVHAGDVVGQEILHQLAAIAPVKAVRGNVDVGELGVGLQDQLVLRLGELRALVVHDLGKPEKPHPHLRTAIAAARVELVLYGHSHVPGAHLVAGVLFVNPGSAGPKRLKLPRAVGRMDLEGRRVRVELLDLETRGALLSQPDEFVL